MVAPMPAKAERITDKKSLIKEASLSLSAFPIATGSLVLVSVSLFSSVACPEAEGVGEAEAVEGVVEAGVVADGVVADGVVAEGVNSRERISVKG